jgi:hypothetical protein
METVIEVILVVTLLPIIAVTIASAENLTTTEKSILGLVTLVVVFGLLYGIAKQQGLIKGKK